MKISFKSRFLIENFYPLSLFKVFLEVSSIPSNATLYEYSCSCSFIMIEMTFIDISILKQKYSFAMTFLLFLKLSYINFVLA